MVSVKFSKVVVSFTKVKFSAVSLKSKVSLVSFTRVSLTSIVGISGNIASSVSFVVSFPVIASIPSVVSFSISSVVVSFPVISSPDSATDKSTSAPFISPKTPSGTTFSVAVEGPPDPEDSFAAPVTASASSFAVSAFSFASSPIPSTIFSSKTNPVTKSLNFTSSVQFSTK